MYPDRMIRLSAAPTVVERITGERPHVGTLHRWAQRGLSGVRLQTAFAGGHRRTTESWIREFFAAVTEARDGHPVAPPTASHKQRVDQADAALDRAGI